jgi:hypothetical protein
MQIMWALQGFPKTLQQKSQSNFQRCLGLQWGNLKRPKAATKRRFRPSRQLQLT